MGCDRPDRGDSTNYKYRADLYSIELTNKQSSGPDGIPDDMLKLIINRKPAIILDTLNKCLAEGLFPIPWNVAKLVLFQKDNKPLEEPSSYRPILSHKHNWKTVRTSSEL